MSIITSVVEKNIDFAEHISLIKELATEKAHTSLPSTIKVEIAIIEKQIVNKESTRTGIAHFLSLSSGAIAGIGLFILLTTNPIGIGVGIGLLIGGAFCLFALSVHEYIQNKENLPTLILTGLGGAFLGFIIVAAAPILMNKIGLIVAGIFLSGGTTGLVTSCDDTPLRKKIISAREDKLVYETTDIDSNLKTLTKRNTEIGSSSQWKQSAKEKLSDLSFRLNDLLQYREKKLRSKMANWESKSEPFRNFISDVKQETPEIRTHFSLGQAPLEFKGDLSELTKLRKMKLNLDDLTKKINSDSH